MPRRSPYKLIWRGDIVSKKLQEHLSGAMTEMGLRAEKYSKRKLYKGHGVRTGTMKRGIHIAVYRYKFENDHLPPTINTPERGGIAVKPSKIGDQLKLSFGCGQVYSLFWRRRFTDFLQRGYDEALEELPAILKSRR